VATVVAGPKATGVDNFPKDVFKTGCISAARLFESLVAACCLGNRCLAKWGEGFIFPME